MISDSLFDAAKDLKYYLSDETFRETYTGETRQKIVLLLKEMEDVIIELNE